MSATFDIDFVTSHFSTCNLIYYLDLIRAMSNDELRALRVRVREHQSNARSQRAFADVEQMSTHQAIIKAINHELLRRSSAFRVASVLFPVRKFTVEAFSGLELRFDDRFGVLYSRPKLRKSLWHLPHNVLLSTIWQFIVRNEKAFVAAILGGIGALIAKYVMW